MATGRGRRAARRRSRCGWRPRRGQAAGRGTPPERAAAAEARAARRRLAPVPAPSPVGQSPALPARARGAGPRDRPHRGRAPARRWRRSRPTRMAARSRPRARRGGVAARSLLEPRRACERGRLVARHRRMASTWVRGLGVLARSGSLTRGTNSSAIVTAAANSPPPTIVAVEPTRPEIGPVRANETGTSPTDTSQSTLDTRPSSSRGTSSWRRLVQMTCPSMKVAPEMPAMSIGCHSAVMTP